MFTLSNLNGDQEVKIITHATDIVIESERVNVMTLLPGELVTLWTPEHIEKIEIAFGKKRENPHHESCDLAEKIEKMAEEMNISVITHGTAIFKTAFFEIGAGNGEKRRFIFTTIAIGAMPKQEGISAPGVETTREKAVEGFLKETREWLAKRRQEVGDGATLAWRKLPEVSQQEDGKFQVRARLAVA